MGKFLRFVGILFMGLTAVFTVLGGVGTTCVALAAEIYDSMVALVPYKWLYVIFVFATITAGVMMMRATFTIVRRRPSAYRDTIISLVIGIVIGTIHMVVSRNLRGSSMPVDAVVYTAVFTLIVFLFFRIPGIWQKVDFTQAKKQENQKASGAAAIAVGILVFSIQYLMASTHTIRGINYADAFHTTMTITGWGFVLCGFSLIFLVYIKHKLSAGNLQKRIDICLPRG